MQRWSPLQPSIISALNYNVPVREATIMTVAHHDCTNFVSIVVLRRWRSITGGTADEAQDLKQHCSACVGGLAHIIECNDWLVPSCLQLAHDSSIQRRENVHSPVQCSTGVCNVQLIESPLDLHLAEEDSYNDIKHLGAEMCWHPPLRKTFI